MSATAPIRLDFGLDLALSNTFSFLDTPDNVNSNTDQTTRRRLSAEIEALNIYSNSIPRASSSRGNFRGEVNDNNFYKNNISKSSSNNSVVSQKSIKSIKSFALNKTKQKKKRNNYNNIIEQQQQISDPKIEIPNLFIDVNTNNRAQSADSVNKRKEAKPNIVISPFNRPSSSTPKTVTSISTTNRKKTPSKIIGGYTSPVPIRDMNITAKNILSTESSRHELFNSSEFKEAIKRQIESSLVLQRRSNYLPTDTLNKLYNCPDKVDFHDEFVIKCVSIAILEIRKLSTILVTSKKVQNTSNFETNKLLNQKITQEENMRQQAFNKVDKTMNAKKEISKSIREKEENLKKMAEIAKFKQNIFDKSRKINNIPSYEEMQIQNQKKIIIRDKLIKQKDESLSNSVALNQKRYEDSVRIC
jgi:hypothetical protein